MVTRTRTYTCSLCGKVGHNKRGCGKSVDSPASISPTRTVVTDPGVKDPAVSTVAEVFSQLETENFSEADNIDVPVEGEPVVGFTSEDLQTWWELSHQPIVNSSAPQLFSTYPSPPPASTSVYPLAIAQMANPPSPQARTKKIVENARLCADFLSKIPDNVSCATDTVEWDDFLGHFPVEAQREMVKMSDVPTGVLTTYTSYADEGAEKKFKQLGRSDHHADDIPAVIGGALQNPRLPAAELSRMSNHPHAWVREVVASNTSLPPEVFAILTHDDDIQVRLTALANPSCPGDVVAGAVNDSEWYVRWVAAAHPSGSEPVRLHLLGDENECVRQVAHMETKTPLGKRKRPKRKKDTAVTVETVLASRDATSPNGKVHDGEVSRHVGVPGGAATVVAGKVTRTRSLYNEFGGSRLIVVATPAGEVTLFSSASWAYDDVREGDNLIVKGSVRSHGEFNGTLTTKMSKVKLLSKTTHEEEGEGE